MSPSQLKLAIRQLKGNDHKHRVEIDALKKRLKTELAAANAKVEAAQVARQEAIDKLSKTIERLGGLEQGVSALMTMTQNIKCDTDQIKVLKSLLRDLEIGVIDLKKGQNFTAKQVKALLWFFKSVDTYKPGHIQ